MLTMVGGIQNSVPMMSVYSSSLRHAGEGGSAVLQSQASKSISTHPVNQNDILQSQSAKAVPFSNSITQAQDTLQATSSQSDDETSTRESQRQKTSQEQQVAQIVSQLKARDTEVRAHEMAHLSTAGSYARGGMSFTYQTGPDGHRYAIGGEVGIDTSSIPGDPEATLQKAMVIQRAALAPAEPSAQDQKVAQVAMQMMAQARVDISTMAAEEKEKQVSESDERKDSSSLGDAKTFKGGEIESKNNNNDGDLALNSERQQFNLRLTLPLSERIAS